jgi:hypothetical protein
MHKTYDLVAKLILVGDIFILSLRKITIILALHDKIMHHRLLIY